MQNFKIYQEKLERNGVINPLKTLRYLYAYILKTTYDQTFFKEINLKKGDKKKLDVFIDRLSKGEPLSRILGHTVFWNNTFIVTKDTLDPRPESEILIKAVLDNFKDHKQILDILDLGIGTGCLLLTLLKEYPLSFGVGVDKNPKSIEIALKNAKLLALSERCNFLVSNWGENLNGQFDIIISNPPYVAFDDTIDKAAQYDPLLALYGGKDGLEAYKCIFKDIRQFCRDKTKIFFEIGYKQKEKVINIAKKHNFSLLKCYNDLSGIERCLCFI
ncbi:MAG: peptide chain release factor N(5)-glutamine methyltransferase [Alphaproteobacteria bacterium]